MIRNALVSIPTPCHENWDAMSVAEKGRFCANCQKDIVDFTQFSDRQIIEEINGGTKLCGRLTSAQLNRELHYPKEKSPLWVAALSGVLTLIGSGDEIAAQEKRPIEKADTTLIDDASRKGDSIRNVKTISGVVSDETGTLPGANVQNKRSGKLTQTDIDGRFSIDANENDTLIFSYVGMANENYIVREKRHVNIAMKMSGALVGEIIVSRKRSFFGRVLTWFGNLFRSNERKRPTKYCPY